MTLSPAQNDPQQSAGDVWLDLDATASLVGGYVWVDRELHRILGEWVGHADGDRLRVALAEQSRERGELAASWVAQLLAHVAADHDELIAAPSADFASYVQRFDALAAHAGPDALPWLRDALLPAQLEQLRWHLGVARSVSDGPVIVQLRTAIDILDRHRESLTSLRADDAPAAVGAKDRGAGEPPSVPSFRPLM